MELIWSSIIHGPERECASIRPSRETSQPCKVSSGLASNAPRRLRLIGAISKPEFDRSNPDHITVS
jgi:hypothetical protein